MTPEAKLALLQLRQAFTEASILHHFDPECYIRIEIAVFGYAIGSILSQLTPDSREWHYVAFFSRKMIPAETRYKTHDQELLAIFEAFKTWCDYFKGCKFEVLVFINHNNLHQFMDIKSLSSRQVRWPQELSRYYFRIDYCQGKANAVGDTLLRFPQKSQSEKEELRTENTQILHRLQSSMTHTSLAGLSLSGHNTGRLVAYLLLLHQVLICGTYIFPRLCQSWEELCGELAGEEPYQ